MGPIQRIAVTIVAFAFLSGSAAAQGTEFSAVAGKVCRGYYKQSEGGAGQLARPESAFKTTPVDRDGTFALAAVRAAPGSSDGWETTNGSHYLAQGSTRFAPQPDGSWLFANPAGGSRYYLTRVAGGDADTVLFTVRYEHERGYAVGKARCTVK